MEFSIIAYLIGGIIYESMVLSNMDRAQLFRVQGWEIVIEALGWGLIFWIAIIVSILRPDLNKKEK